ncbi:unnamed protein product [Porites evermanni]|uniref:RING-type domain-containing protein n=1 Tax=Porites evermanni TaxID=104178 RepID=A0ABN8RTE0_9CNID|nr:unnamed protein product [Porites evermanni]
MIKLLRSGQKPHHLLHQTLNRDFIQISQSPIAGGFPTMTLVLLQEKQLRYSCQLSRKSVPQETTARGQPKGDAKFYLKTFDTTVDTKALPLGYTFAKLEPQTIPDQDLVCDYAECSENSITDAVRLNCFHTFHKTCLDNTGNKCPICVPRLSKKISSVCEAFNESIIKLTSRSTNKNILELSVGSPLNSSWITLMLSSIVRGNNAYDRVTLGIGSPYFSVADAKANLVSVLGNLTLEDTIDLSITTTDPQIPQSSLDFYLQRLDREPNLAAPVIANGMTICFVGYNNKIYVLDSHPHNAFGPVFGAMVGMTAKPDLEEFLVNIKRQISPAFNVCSLTFVSF